VPFIGDTALGSFAVGHEGKDHYNHLVAALIFLRCGATLKIMFSDCRLTVFAVREILAPLRLGCRAVQISP